jgi:hypothetical protein
MRHFRAFLQKIQGVEVCRLRHAYGSPKQKDRFHTCLFVFLATVRFSSPYSKCEHFGLGSHFRPRPLSACKHKVGRKYCRRHASRLLLPCKSTGYHKFSIALLGENLPVVKRELAFCANCRNFKTPKTLQENICVL